MFRKNHYTFLLAIALFLVGATTAFAQAGQARGKVELKNADGTTAPIADVAIDVYRTDIKGKIPSTKTNKKGEFVIIGLLSGARYALAVSGATIAADVFPEIKAGDEKLTITVVLGDGKPMTEDQVRQLLANPPKNLPTGELTAEQKKQQEEQAKLLAKYESEKKNVENINAVTKKSAEEGNKAYTEKNYDVAIARYDDGINADPTFAPTATLFLNNKSSALISRAIVNYNAAQKGDPNNLKTALASVKKDLTDAVAASNRSLDLLKNNPQTDVNEQKKAAIEKSRAYSNLMDGYTRLVGMNIDVAKGKDAMLILGEYSATETDAARKIRTQVNLASALSRAGELENAVTLFRQVLEASPDNPDALGGLGLSLVGLGSGATPVNTAMMQEGLNLMQRFAETAADTHPLKADVKAAVDYLKTQQLTPQKTSKPTKKKG